MTKYKLVPIEPTKIMLQAASDCDESGDVTYHGMYQAMLSAAPHPQTVDVDALKREVVKIYSPNAVASEAIKAVIDHLANTGRLR